MMDEIQKLFDKSERLEKEYEQHFNIAFPERIIGWWDPLNIVDYVDELRDGVKSKEKDIRTAIATDTPIEEISEEMWKDMIF